jgi:hypothetical protein
VTPPDYTMTFYFSFLLLSAFLFFSLVVFKLEFFHINKDYYNQKIIALRCLHPYLNFIELIS